MFRGIAAASIIAFAGVAGASTDPIEPGVTVLNAAREGAASVSGQAAVHTRRFTVASNHHDAIVVNGRGRIECSDVRIAGGYELSGNHAQIQGAIWTGYTEASDPLAARAAALNAMAAQYTGENAPDGNGAIKLTNGSHTLSPGFYPGGMDISGGNITLNPGVYILGAGMSITGQSRVEGIGVTIIVLQGNVNVAGGAIIRIDPSETGDLAEFAIALPASNRGNISLTGNSELSIQGAIYAPRASMSVTGQAIGSASPFVGEVVVVDTLTLAGRGSIIIGAMGPMNLVSERKID